MDEQSRQVRFLIAAAAVICAVIIGYNAFYVPDAPLSEPVVTADLPSASSGEAYAPSSVPPASSAPKPAVSVQSAGKVNINTATAQELSERLSGIGDSLAKRIIAYRNKHGPFRSVGEIKNVSGIGEKKFEEIRSSITVG